MDSNSTKSKTLVLCAHPDDEVLGCGGTIARLRSAGRHVSAVFLSMGVGARGSNAGEASRRYRAATEAAKTLGGYDVEVMDFPDNQMDTVGFLEIVKAIEAAVKRLKPNVIYTHHANDLNIDHAIVHRAVLTACRPLPGSSVRSIYAFETLSSTEWEPAGLGRQFQPTRFVDISNSLDAKMGAMRAYGEEMRPFPHPRSPEAIEALARFRGAQSGLLAAEAFVVVREIT